MESNDVITPQLEQLVGALLGRTEAGVLRWEFTDDPKLYAYVAASGAVKVGYRYIESDRASYPAHVLLIEDEKGDTVEHYLGPHKLVADLYAAARRAAHAARSNTTVIDALMRELDAIPA